MVGREEFLIFLCCLGMVDSVSVSLDWHVGIEGRH